MDGLETEQAAALRDVGDQIVRRAVADRARRPGRLVDVLVVEHDLRAPRGLIVEIVLPAEAHDVAGVVASEAGLLGRLRHGRRREPVREQIDRAASERGGSSNGATTLERVGLELIKRLPYREIGKQPVVDHLERDAVVGRHRVGAERVDGLGVERAVADIAVAAHIAAEQRAFERVALAADDGVVVQIAEAAALDPVARAVDLAAAPEAEVDRAAGGIVAEHRRGRAAIDVDAAIGMRVDEVGAGEAVRLRHRKAVLQHHDVADAEAVARVGAADGDAEVARAVALLERDAGAFLQQVLDGEGGLVLDALAAHRGDGLTRWLRQRTGSRQ